MKVLDINDNVPIFNPTEYRANITEHSSIETTVVHLRATDLDVCNMSLKILLYHYAVSWKKTMHVGTCAIVIRT